MLSESGFLPLTNRFGQGLKLGTTPPKLVEGTLEFLLGLFQGSPDWGQIWVKI